MGEEDMVPPPPGEAPPPPVTPPPASPPAQTGYGAYEPKPKKSPLEGLVSNETLSVIVAVGLLLVVLGAVLVHAAPFQTNYNADDLDIKNNNQGTNGVDLEERTNDQARQNTMTYIGNILNDLGMFLVVLSLLLAAFLRTDLGDTVRFGLLFTVGLIMLGMGI